MSENRRVGFFLTHTVYTSQSQLAADCRDLLGNNFMFHHLLSL